jgi:hypothetical protein
VNQALGIALEIFGPPALAAGLVTAGLIWIGFRCLRTSDRLLVIPVAVAGGFVLGCFLLKRSTLPLVPDQAWHWLPYLTLAVAALSAAIAQGYETHRLSAVLAVVAVAWLSGGVLTPNWPLFGKTWPVSIVWLGLYLSVLSMPLFLIASEPNKDWLAAAMALTAMIVTVTIAAMVSFRLAQPAGIAAGSLTAAFVCLMLLRPRETNIIRSLTPLNALLVGGSAFTAGVEPDPPLTWLLAIPLLPLAFWPLKTVFDRAFARPSAGGQIS